MFYSQSSGFLCATLHALAKWNKIRTLFELLWQSNRKVSDVLRLHFIPLTLFFYPDKTDYLFVFRFFSRQEPQQQYSRMSATYSLTTRNLNMLCRRSMALNCKERKKFTHLQYDPILICLARNCKRTATAAVAAVVQRRKIVGQTLKKRSWWSCLEKMKISCDTKPSAPLNGCRLLASCTCGARNKT